MSRFSFLNNVTGWVVFTIATVCYLLTIEPTASFWDCGEFIASANGLEVGHPPGAPFWMLISRLFIIFLGSGNEALAVNIESALASSFTILFLFWSISHLARKFFSADEEDSGKTIAVLGSAAVGALAYAFSDSFWFSAVEGEVYALSSLFTAVVFWAILKWEGLADRGGEYRWILLIAYLMGLSIGVHLLNLLAIPAICLVYYFKRYDFSWKGILITLAVSGVLLMLVLSGVIKGLINLAARFELLFVNDFGMGFNSGVLVYGILVLGVLGGLIWYSRKRSWLVTNTLALSVLLIVLGYSTFALIVIRSAANPPMDENNPENLFSLLSYLNREQYGDRPLLTGQYWNSPTVDEEPQVDGDPSFIKSYSVWATTKKGERRVKSYRDQFAAEQYIASKDSKRYYLVREYIDSGEKKGSVPNFMKEYTSFFPRMYSSQANHEEYYKEWSNYKGWNDFRKRKRVQEQEAELDQVDSEYIQTVQGIGYYMDQGYSQSDLSKAFQQKRLLERRRERLRAELMPSMKENMRFFVNYQMDWMYWRYFMWNFAGRQNDKQGHGGIVDGNWLTGVSFIDQERLGNRDRLPESFLNNKGFNKFFLLPLILGLIGLVVQAVRLPKDFTVVGLLFLLTGAAIVVYLNQYPYQPRERDYAYVGSFYAFAIWIGLGVMGLYLAARKMTVKDLAYTAGLSVGAGVLIYIFEGSGDHGFSYCLLYMAAVGSAAIAIMFGMGKANLDGKATASVATALALAVPLVMAAGGWDDHSRAKRRTGVDFAKNYLDTLEPNAILFTNGDNDTFPLWYVQEVEGYRTDVRVVNLSLLNTDWYIDQMKRKAYNSDPVPFSITEDKYRQGTRDVLYIQPIDPESREFMTVDKALKFALDDGNALGGYSKPLHSLPAKRLKFDIDSAHVLATGTVDPDDAGRIVDAIEWELPGRYITKNSMMVLDLIRTNNWERPIYFAVTTGNDAYIGMGRYFRLEGLAYRLVPIRSEVDRQLFKGEIDSDRMFNNMVNKFQWGNMDDPEGIYLDENNLRMVTNLRLQMANLAETLIDEGDMERAKVVQDLSLQVMPEHNVPYDQVMFQFVKNYYAMTVDTAVVNYPGVVQTSLSSEQVADVKVQAEELLNRLFDLQEDEVEFYETLDPQHALDYRSQMDLNLDLNQSMIDVLSVFDPENPLISELEERMAFQTELFDAKESEIERWLGRRSGSPGDF